MVSAAAEAWYAFIADAESDQGGFVEVEGELLFRSGGIFVHQAAVDADDLQRAFLEIVSFFRIQREDLPGYLAVRHDERSDGFRSLPAHGFGAMPAIGSPETSLRSDHCDDGIEKTPGFVDNVREPFVMSIGEISLERGGLDSIDWQGAQQYRMTGKRFLVRSNNATAGFRDCL